MSAKAAAWPPYVSIIVEAGVITCLLFVVVEAGKAMLASLRQ